jgi:hypothetical protein
VIGARRRPDWVRVPMDLYARARSWAAWLPSELAPDPKGNPRGELVLWAPPWALELARELGGRPLGDRPSHWERVVGLSLSEPDMAVACELVDDALVAYRAGGADAVWRRVEEVEQARRRERFGPYPAERRA